jgi:lactoylglutathione lyase
MSRFPPGQMFPNGHNDDPPLPADHPTIGLKLNHVCLRVRDIDASRAFYMNMLGMRTVAVFNAGPFTIYFLGHPTTDAHRGDLKLFGNETVPQVPHTLGLLELWHVHGSEKQEDGFYSTGNTPPHLGFCHLGFSVPDLPKTLERLKENGVKVFKDLGIATRASLPISDWENEKGVGVEVVGEESEIHQVFKMIFENLIYCQDPVGLPLELECSYGIASANDLIGRVFNRIGASGNAGRMMR